MKLLKYIFLLLILVLGQSRSDACNIAQFLNDIGNTPHFRNHMNSLPPGQYEKHFKAYQKILAKIPTSSHKHAMDPDVLNQLVSMMEPGSTFRTNRPTTWAEELDDILVTADRSPCNTCGNAGEKGMSKMDDLLKNVEYLVDNFNVESHAGAKKFYLWLQNKTVTGSGNPTVFQIDEAHHTLEVIKRLNLDNSANLGADFPIGPTSGKKQFDLSYDDIFHELKNKIYTSEIGFEDIDQLGNGYLINATSIDNIKWEVRFGKYSDSYPDPASLKEVLIDYWQDAFLYDVNINDLIMNMKPGMKQSLDIAEDVNGNPLTLSEQISAFGELIDDQTSVLYSFIQVF